MSEVVLVAPPAGGGGGGGLSHLQPIVTLQAVIGSHHHVALTPLPALVKVQQPVFVENLAVLSHFLLTAGTHRDLQGHTVTFRDTQ